MRILSKTGDPNLAEVYVAGFRGSNKHLAEFVDARDPALSKDEKWVVIASTQFGCPINCPMCDAGGSFNGSLTADEMLAQIEYVVRANPPDRLRNIRKFKVQFARMGEPALNPAVLDVLHKLPKLYSKNALIPCLATTAPESARVWFDELFDLRKTLYKGRPFQLQFSIVTTDETARDGLIPVRKLTFKEISAFAKRFSSTGPRKVSLNFPLIKDALVEPRIIREYFSPDDVCIKITPLNPTDSSKSSGIETLFEPEDPEGAETLCNEFLALGFDVILSVGDTRENTIGSNCGMAVKKLSGGHL